MDDLISRRAAIDALDCINGAEEVLRALPSVQPEPHEGHWIGGDGSYICSECNGSPMDFIDTMSASFDAYVETPMNYCPNCGADMRKENES